MRKNPTRWNANDPQRNWHLNVFFGLHYDLHAERTDTELGAALTHEHLRAELEKVRPDWVQCDCKGHRGYTSWPTEVGSTSPGVVKDALRIHRDVTRELGIPLVVHYSGVWDDRAIELHPEWARVGPRGDAAGKEGWATGATCNLSGYTDELMIPQMLELIDKYDVDGFWIDGENWAVRACYCDRCRQAFTASTGINDIPNSPEEPHWLAWAAFHRHLFAEHVRKYTDAIHARNPSCLVCSNWMYTVSHPEEIEVPVDYISGDFSWVWSTDSSLVEGRYMEGRGLSWNLMAWGFTTAAPKLEGWTFKPAAQLCQEAATVISLGGAIQVYDNPQRNGHLTNWHQDTLAEVARFVRARQPWCRDTESVPQVAVLHSASHYFANVGEALMVSGGHTAHLAMSGAVRALLENHCHVDILSEAALTERINEYALIVIPEQTQLPAAVKTAVAHYVANGGKVLLSGVNVASDFTELAGVKADGAAREETIYLPIGREATPVRGAWQPVIVTDAEPLQLVLNQQEPGFNDTPFPAVTLRQVGQGAVLAVHAQFFNDFEQTRYPRSRKLVGEWLAALAPDFLLQLGAPAHLHLSLRRQHERLILHFINLGTAHPTSPKQVIIDEVPSVGPVTVRIKMPQRPAQVYLAPAQEAIAWDWQDGVLTATIDSVGIMDSLIVE